MDRNNATAGPSTAALAVPAFAQLHSTTALLSSAVQLAHDSFQDHLDDYADAHRWIDSFFDKIDGQSKVPVSHGQPRAGVFELMKTPGRKRIAAASSTNTNRLGSTSTAAAKDPLATLLFPTGPAPRSPAHADKENGLASPQPHRTSPRKLLSPLGPTAAAGRRSPMRAASPAAPKQPHQVQVAPPAVAAPVAPEPAVKVLDFAAAPAPVEPVEDDEPADMPAHDLSNVVEEDEDEDEPVVDQEPTTAGLAGEDKGDLSIIGEEEEPEPSSTDASLVTDPSGTSSLVASAVLVPRPVVEAPAPAPLPPVAAPLPAPIAAPADLPLSPPKQRTVSGASSVAPEADDAEDSSAPLNDAPSVLRSASASDALRSSLSASTSTSSVRTPGGSTSRLGTSALYSAAKIGLGSSPPPTSSSTLLAGPSRTSTGGGGARQINFVGLSKKKSLGLGLGLGRNWATSMGSSAANDSQGSIQSGPASTQATSTSTALPLELAQGVHVTATGAVKRKSLADPDSAHKTAKTDSAATAPTSQEQEDEEDRKRRQMLANRLQDLNNKARQSTLGGRQSNVAGPGAYPSSLYGAGRPLNVPTSSSMYHPTSMAAATKPLLVSTSSSSSSTLPTASSHLNLTSTASTAHGADPAPTTAVRRPSVMERVKSFEHNTTGQEQLNPPSPSKIPSSLYSTLSTGPHSPRAMSPQPFQSSSALSPRVMRIASPSAPSSPRALTRSATSGLPLATFGSPKLGVPAARSPPAMTTSASAGAPLSIAAVLSPPPPAAPKPQPQQQPVKAPVALTMRSPVEVLRREPMAPVVRSTTPGGSPPRSPLKLAPVAPVNKPQRAVETFVLEDEDDEELDDASEDEEDAFSIRAINASTPSSAIVAAEAAAARQREQAAAAEQAAHDLEEQDAERERAAMLAKRLPSLPEARPPVDDENSGDESDGERSVVRTAVKEDLGHKASPSKVVLHGTASSSTAVEKGKAKEASSAPASDNDDDDDDMDEDDDDEDRTAMSMLSTATTTLNLSHQPFKPITKTAQLPKQTATAKSSLASSTSTSAFGLNRSTGASTSGIKKPVDTKVKSIQRANAASKKEKEELDRRNALREQKRAAIAQKKLDDERKLKADGLEKKRKEREETASKVKAAAAARGAKPKPAGDDEPAKKRKIEVEVKIPRPEQKKLAQPARPIPSSSTASTSTLAQSQGRSVGMGPPPLNKSTGASGMFAKPPAGPSSSSSYANPLSKSAGASSMVGQPFMSAKIRLPEASSSTAGPALPPRILAPTVPKPFGSSMRPPQAQQPALPPRVVEPQEPLQELPDIDSEYSDSDDEAHERKRKALPGWAQSPAVAQALYDQQQVNPDEIFGPLPKLSIGEFFRNSASAARLRGRTSSAQWDGTDALSQTDLARYQRAMGYKSALAQQSDAAHRGGDDEQRR